MANNIPIEGLNLSISTLRHVSQWLSPRHTTSPLHGCPAESLLQGGLTRAEVDEVHEALLKKGLTGLRQ